VLLAQLCLALDEHLAGIIDAHEVDVRWQCPVEHQQRRSGRTAQVVDVAARLHDILGQFRNHALDLAIERHRPRQHVVEHLRNFLAEAEVRNSLALVREDAVLG
jgi:hypothetical protein